MSDVRNTAIKLLNRFGKFIIIISFFVFIFTPAKAILASDSPASQLPYNIADLLSYTQTISGTLYTFSPKSYYSHQDDPNQLATKGIISVPVVPQGNTGTCLAASLVAVANAKGSNLTLAEVVDAYQKKYGSTVLENNKLISLMKNYGFQASFNNFCLGTNNVWKNISFEEYKSKSYAVIANTLLKGNPVTVYPATSATTYHATTIVGITLDNINGNQEPYFHIVDSIFGRVKSPVNSLLAAMLGPNSYDGCYIGAWSYVVPTSIPTATLTPTKIPTQIPTLTPKLIANTTIKPSSIPTPTQKLCQPFLSLTPTLNDFSIWRNEYINGSFGSLSKVDWHSDFDCNAKVTLNDYAIWRANYIKSL